MEGLIKDYIVTSNQLVDLRALTDGAGVWKPTFHNYGNVNFRINGIHTIEPNKCPFPIDVDVPIVSKVQIDFDEPTEAGQQKKCVISYVVKHCS
ncbi:hypothetical protein EZY14_009115 [Kordia sp. TARA_039_SRF]|nr:hypothetical protein EZY14_009115 [Kordia sp. TARA_039_SRF]